MQKELLALNNDRQEFLALPREDAVDLRISIGEARKTSMGWPKIINNIGSGLTLGIIPWRDDDQACQLIKVESESFSKELMVEASSCLEVGHLPLPLLGIGDILCFTGGTVFGAICGVITVDLKYFLLGVGILLSRDEKKEQTAQGYLVENVGSDELAKAIAASLSSKDYQAAMKQLEFRKRFLSASIIADYAEMQRLDKQLRPFALENSPSLWKHIQEVRAALDVQEEKVNGLRENLFHLGIQPEKDEAYVKICTERYQLALLLKKLYGELKEAYREAQLFENSFTRDDYDNIQRKTKENGIQDAKMLQKHFRQLREK